MRKVINTYKEISKLKRIVRQINSKVLDNRLKVEDIFLVTSSNGKFNGFCFPKAELIFIDLFIPFHEKVEVLCHELTHVVMFQILGSKKYTHEEPFVYVFEQIYGNAK